MAAEPLVAEPIAEPLAEPLVEPMVEPLVEPIVEPLAEPVMEEQVFCFAHPPISPICRTPLFPYLTFLFFFLPTAGRPYGEFGAPHGVNVAPHTRTRAISTWLRRVETRAHLHRRSTQGLGGGGQTVGG